MSLITHSVTWLIMSYIIVLVTDQFGNPFDNCICNQFDNITGNQIDDQIGN